MSWVCNSGKIEARAAVAFVSSMASALAGKMLWSYLDEVISSQTIDEIVTAVQRNSTYEKDCGARSS
jgi:hypothetical protein